ncbi:MAG TPA: glycosyltransferase [Halothiobacillus sp.]|nr:glycosyltransferase [Halothiobacillus sp.]
MVRVIIPTVNAGVHWAESLGQIVAQSIGPEVLVMDSGSTDGTVSLATSAGFAVRSIPKADFNHGGTRQLAVELLPDAEIIVFMTQDAILADNHALSRLIAAFDDPQVGVAYGRQLPRPQAGLIESHARLFNYPDKSHVATLADRDRMGIKAAFSSNSFAAYRRSALQAVGGFPRDIILGEDTFVAARMLLAGWKVAYQADALVFHSHGYSYVQEFRRYFDIGVFHHREYWMLTAFGKPEGEGGRFVRSELSYLRKNAPWLIPSALLRTGLKYLGYRLGRIEGRLPVSLKRVLSMHRGFW